MKAFIYNNQTFVMIAAVVALLVALYFIIKALPTKVEKKQKNSEKKADAETKIETKEPEPDKVDQNIQQSAEIEKTQESENKNKKEDKKPKIVHVFKREQREDSSNGEKKKSVDPIYDRTVEFVNTSKNIAKFKSFADESAESDSEAASTDEYGFVNDFQEDCNLCENKVKHFDHSRRLSKAIREDKFDELFESHISEKYMNIDIDKHLNLNEKFQRKLFERTERMLANSDGKIKNDEHEKSHFSLFDNNEIEEDFEEDEENPINMKTALIADTYLGKRKR